MPYLMQTNKGEELNRLYPEDRPVNDWYRFVLSYPPHLVKEYIARFELDEKSSVLDPFCGTGTTLLACKKQGIKSIGIEANPVVKFAASVKTDWNIEPDVLIDHAEMVASETRELLLSEGVDDDPLFQPLDKDEIIELRTLSPEQEKLIITNSISPKPLHKALALIEKIHELKHNRCYDYERLALAKQLVYTASNLRFGPEVGVGKAKPDSPVVGPWLAGIRSMCEDLIQVRSNAHIPSVVHFGDARNMKQLLEPQSIDAVITSPPYPNEKDYTRTTRLESVLLGFMTDRHDLRTHKTNLIRSNTRGVYKIDNDKDWVTKFDSVQKLAETIENRRIELNKTSGFEKLYAHVVRHYFGGMTRHLENLKPILKPGACLAYVVGDQASYFRILIKTGNLLAEIAERLGYKVIDIDLFRKRFSTATQQYIREEVVLLRWEGQSKG